LSSGERTTFKLTVIPPPPPESFTFTIDTRMGENFLGVVNFRQIFEPFYNGTATTFAIPVGSVVGYYGNHFFDWIIDWGDGCVENISGYPNEFGGEGLPHTYDTAGEYTITINSNGSAYNGWMNPFGFGMSETGCNAQANKNMFKSIDTPIPKYAKGRGAASRFAGMFFGCRNAVGIPSDLFSLIETDGDGSFYQMFWYTFSGYAFHSTTAEIPPGLFDTIRTDSAHNLADMFSSTFMEFAYKSQTASIPANLFKTINVSGAVDLTSTFSQTFGSYAYESTQAEIPGDLFGIITSHGDADMRGTLGATFYRYAYNSPGAEIPAELFSTINISGAHCMEATFNSTFAEFGYNSQVGSIPGGLFSTFDTTGVANIRNLFSNTFSGCFRNSPVADIPAGLFDTIDTTRADDMSYIYGFTFNEYGYESLIGSIPANLFDKLDLTNADNVAGVMTLTFYQYAFANKTPTTDLNTIWGNANFAGRPNPDNVGSDHRLNVLDHWGMFYWTFRHMPSLYGDAEQWMNTHVGFLVPTINPNPPPPFAPVPTHTSPFTFQGTAVTNGLEAFGTDWYYWGY